MRLVYTHKYTGKTYVTGIELKVGDKIAVWWKPKYDVVTGFKPHPKYDEMFNTKGARIASFAISELGMTIPPNGEYELISR